MIKIGFLLEGWTDLIAFRILTARVLGAEVVPIDVRRRASGLHGVLAAIDRACWTFWRSGAAGAVIAVDNDDSLAVHSSDHVNDDRCRTCAIHARLPSLPDRPPLGPLCFAIGVPVQALESWLLFGMGVASPEALAKAKLKIRAFGSDHPTRAQTEPLVTRVCTNVDLDALADGVPSFGRFAAELSRWPRDASR